MLKRILSLFVVAILICAFSINVYAQESDLDDQELLSEESMTDTEEIYIKVENAHDIEYAKEIESEVSDKEILIDDSELEEKYATEDESTVYEEQSIVDSGECGLNSRWTLNSSGVLTISGSDDIDDPYLPWAGDSRIKKVRIMSGITSIRESAFWDCDHISSVSIPDTVTKIGENAFADCIKLSEITIPDSIDSIEYGTFENCVSLSKIVIPNSITKIGDRAFYGCSGLTSITIPDHSVKYIGAEAFEYCERLKSIRIPDGMISLKSGAFRECIRLENVELPDSLTDIGSLAFYNCRNLSSITIPDNVRKIGSNAFKNCWNLITVKLPKGVGVDFTKASLIGVKDQYSDEVYSYKNAIDVKLGNKYQSDGIDYDYYEQNIAWSIGKVTLHIVGRGQNIGAVIKDYWILYRDVPKNHSYANAVYWAAQKGIAMGYSDQSGCFGVSDSVTRGHVVTFLWRIAGKPKPKKKLQSFTDIPPSHNYYDAIQWASEMGIAAGYTDGTFRPGEKCTRGQIAMFLWRYNNKPNPKKNTQTFKDVPTNHNFYKAIQWASEQNITKGYSNGTFGPNKTCTRGQCVTFLYRMLK